ncbi:MAG: hypothetical protein H7067_00690 [Burkholderiales bacterium]|nr:hypothetical protein [Opitutaceae bacterium]
MNEIRSLTLQRLTWTGSNPFGVPDGTGEEWDAGERLRRALASIERDLDLARRVMEAAVLRNDAAYFRNLADVLEHHAACSGRAADPMATEIATWAWLAEARGENLYFNAMWEYLMARPGLPPSYRGMTESGLKSAKVKVRKKAQEIGVVFAIEKRGPRP